MDSNESVLCCLDRRSAAARALQQVRLLGAADGKTHVTQ